MGLIDQLKHFDKDKITLDELVLLSVGAKGLSGEYQTWNLGEPEWLSDARRSIASEIQRQSADRIALELRELDAEDARLMSASEKRAQNQKRREELLAKRAQPVGA